MYAKSLSTRLSGYIGVTGKGAWGKRGAEFGIESLRGHSPVANTHLDFSELAVPSATALGASPLNWTVTTIDAGITGNSIVANSSNGYLLVTPGTAPASGYNLQVNKTDSSHLNTMRWGSGGQTAISAGRDLYWGARVAISSTATWNAGLFMGVAPVDTALMTPATGALDSLTNGFGFYFAPAGTISLVSVRSSATTSITLPMTATTLAHTSSSFRSRDFHDYFIWFHSSNTIGNGTCWLEAYFDGVLVGKLTGLSVTSLTSNNAINSFEIINDPADAGTDCTLAIAELVNGMPRYHVGSGS